MEKYGRDGEAASSYACWIAQATDTHSESVILFSFPLKEWLRERASMLRSYVHFNPYGTNVIYIYIYMEHLFLMFLDHTQRRSTVGRTPLDE